MLPFVFAFFVQFVMLLLLIYLLLYFLSMIISDFFGVPFVPTRGRSISEIFDEVRFRKRDVFYDLGCGDGRLTFYVWQKFGIKSIGIELNPLLHWYTSLKKRLIKADRTIFLKKDLFDVDLRDATVIYVFLFPEVLDRLSRKLSRECRKGTLIVSHGFKIKGFGRKLEKQKTEKPFSTYYYRL